ncbi:MAG: PEP/pyruvate-binding domain-containing protein [Candidatus Eisenbacteria bacterium]
MSKANLYPPFDRHFLDSREDFTIIGTGDLGGKATGLAVVKRMLTEGKASRLFPEIEVAIPKTIVIATDVFDAFLEENRLREIALSDEPDDRIALAFQHGSLSASIVGDLKALMDSLRQPLAIRSSSLLEDAQYRPFAGVYATKMIPNNAIDSETRFRRLTEAIKYVYASTFFREAKAYAKAAQQSSAEEKMAVVLQEVVGERHGDRFYPDLSGVARSYNYYPVGHAAPEDGVASLALGLGKTIVDGGVAWTFSPAYPRTNPPYNSIRDLLKQSQTKFWAVQMGRIPTYDPINEIEYLVESGIDTAEEDGVLAPLVSTYDVQSDRLSTGMAGYGPRVLSFAPLLITEVLPLTSTIRSLLEMSQEEIGAPVEIEFAMTIRRRPYAGRLGFLQVRPLVVAAEEVTVDEEAMNGPRVLAASESALGNGTLDVIRDVVYVKPDRFDTKDTTTIAGQIEEIDHRLAAARTPYLLIGFGRWGTSDPWLGIPVTWSQIAGAKAIVESSLPHINSDASQGSHFFHNITSFQVYYFSVRHTDPRPIDWAWLARQEIVAETEFVRHVRSREPLHIRVDGRTRRGVIVHPELES